jgi:hypothetical protein
VNPAKSLTMALRIPELGPSLGRLVAPAANTLAPRHWIALDDLRYALVTAIFARAGEAREWSAAEDTDLTVATLGRGAWLKAWETALNAVTDRTTEAINLRLDGAAVEARMPRRYRSRLPLASGERNALKARLDAGSAPFREAVAKLEELGAAVRSAHGEGAVAADWGSAISTAARRLEAAWLALEDSLDLEWVRWGRDVEEVRAWRRPLWPLLLGSAVLAALAIYTGLLLGGYLPVPELLRDPVEWVWDRWS